MFESRLPIPFVCAALFLFQHHHNLLPFLKTFIDYQNGWSVVLDEYRKQISFWWIFCPFYAIARNSQYLLSVFVYIFLPVLKVFWINSAIKGDQGWFAPKLQKTGSPGEQLCFGPFCYIFQPKVIYSYWNTVKIFLLSPRLGGLFQFQLANNVEVRMYQQWIICISNHIIY